MRGVPISFAVWRYQNVKQKGKRDKIDPRNKFIWCRAEINKRACRKGDPRKGGNHAE